MKVAYIRWKDAVQEQAADGKTRPVAPALAELHEVGFLLGENEEAVTIGMEQDSEDGFEPGRWRLHIPRVCIQEMRVVELGKAFPVRRPRRNG